MKQIFFFFLLVYTGVQGQEFMRPADNAAQLGMGGIGVSIPSAKDGLHNDMLPFISRGTRVVASSAMPFGIAGWNNSHVQLTTAVTPVSTVSFRLWHNSAGGYSEQRLSVGYGRKLSEKILLGISADGFRRAAESYQADHLISCNLGMVAHILPQVWLGCNIQNPFPPESIGLELPSVFRMGLTWKPGQTMLISAEIENYPDKPVMVKTGIEYRPQTLFAVRAGVRTGGGARLSIGAGFILKNSLTLDIATEWSADLGITPAFMISRTFAATDQINNIHS